MIRTIDIRLNAAHPELPLPEATTYQGAPSTAFLRGVPKACGQWQITAVNVAATFPDGSTTTRAAVLSAGDVWVATIPACATSGRTTSGLRILADGLDENGDAVTGFVLGVADFAVATFDIAPAPGVTSYALRYFDNVPNPAHKGDVTKVDGALKFYDGTAWIDFADVDLSNYASKADATLTERGFSEWTILRNGVDVTSQVGQPELVGLGWYVAPSTVSGDTGAEFVEAGDDATDLEWTAADDEPQPNTIYYTATRTALPGYQLGTQTTKPLASEAEAEALRQGKQDALTWDNSPTYNSQKPVKSGGIWSAIWGALSALPTGFTSLYDWCVSQLSGKVSTSGGTMTGALTVNYSPGTVGQAFTKLFDDKLHVGSATAKAEYKYDRITRTVRGSSVDLGFPFESGTLALTSDLPASETWTFEVDDGQGGTTTVTKSVAIYAGANA